MEHPYRVPLRFDRTLAPFAYRLVNDSGEALRGVTALLDGPGVMHALSPVALAPGAFIDLRIRGADLARSTVLVIRWLRPNNDEYLWRVSF